MQKILLINPSYVPSYAGAKGSIVNPIFPTAALASLAGGALAAGHDVTILDLSYLPYDHNVITEKIIHFQPDIVGVTATTPLMNQLRDISVLIKEKFPHIKVIGGGPHISSMPMESMLESKLDAVFVGEADESFVEYCNGKDVSTIEGIYFRDPADNNKIRHTGARKPIEDLDTLPMPAWHLYDAKIYKEHSSRLFARYAPVASVEFSRGCVYKCDYCASKMTMALGYRKKSPKRCAAEFVRLAELGYREVIIVDDIFTSDQEWAMAVCDAIIESGVKMAWTCTNGIRVESANETLFRKMQKAGCYRVSFGFESGSNEILKSFGKGGKASIEQGIKAANIAQKCGIDVNGFFMLGLSGDNEKTIMETIEYASKLPLDMLKFGRTIAFPGTEMFNKYHELGIISSYNWDDYFTYSTSDIFVHQNLSAETIEKHISLGYRKAVFCNPKFIVRRLIRGIKSGDLFWDLYYSLKFLLMPGLNKPVSSCYYAKDRWPTYEFRNSKISRTEYEAVRKTPKNSTNEREKNIIAST